MAASGVWQKNVIEHLHEWMWLLSSWKQSAGVVSCTLFAVVWMQGPAPDSSTIHVLASPVSAKFVVMIANVVLLSCSLEWQCGVVKHGV